MVNVFSVKYRQFKDKGLIMRRAIYILSLTISATLANIGNTSEKVFVVERESESVAIIQNFKVKSHMKNMHNMNHGIIKFDKNDGYLISRDGFVVHFDPINEKVLHEYKTSKKCERFGYRK